MKSKLSPTTIDNLITEISLLKKLKHPHIVEMKDFLWDDKWANNFIFYFYCNYILTVIWDALLHQDVNTNLISDISTLSWSTAQGETCQRLLEINDNYLKKFVNVFFSNLLLLSNIWDPKTSAIWIWNPKIYCFHQSTIHVLN